MAKKSNYDKLFAALAELVKEIHSAGVQIEAMPEDHEWLEEQLDIIGDLRLESRILKDQCNDTIQAVQGGLK